MDFYYNAIYDRSGNGNRFPDILDIDLEEVGYQFATSSYSCKAYGQNMTSPLYRLAGINNPQLSFYYYVGYVGLHGGIEISMQFNTPVLHLDIQNGSTWFNDFVTPFYPLGSSWVPVTVDLSRFTNQNIRVRFRATSLDVKDTKGPCTALVDDVCIGPADNSPPKCADITVLSDYLGRIPAGAVQLLW